jgi:hypothetical protein
MAKIGGEIDTRRVEKVDNQSMEEAVLRNLVFVKAADGLGVVVRQVQMTT